MIPLRWYVYPLQWHLLARTGSLYGRTEAMHKPQLTGSVPALEIRNQRTGEVCRAHWTGYDGKGRATYIAGPDWEPVIPCPLNRRGEWVACPVVETLHQLRCELRRYAHRLSVLYVPDSDRPWVLDFGATQQRFATADELRATTPLRR